MLGAVLRRALGNSPLARPLAGWSVVTQWPEIVGARVASRSRAVEWRDGQLLVEVFGAVWMAELTLQKRDFSSFGGFVNLKLGYRYFYVIPAVSLFYQNYGDYALLNGQSTSLSGFTVVPSLGFQLRIPNFTK